MDYTNKPVDLEQHLITELYRNVFSLVDDGKIDQAINMARQLFLDHTLDKFREASLHSLLACGDEDPIAHGDEAVRLYKSLLRKEGWNEAEKSKLDSLLDEAVTRLADARRLDRNRKRRELNALHKATKRI